MREILRKFLLFLCIIVFVGSIGYAIYPRVKIMTEQNRIEQLREEKQNNVTDKNVENSNGNKENSQQKEILPKFQNLYQENQDMIGWIKIEDTKIDYPIMQTKKDNPNFYLHNGWDKKESITGLLYLDSRCDIDESENLIVYGHCMRSGEMFGNLKYYKKAEYFEKHQIIEFSSLYADSKYQIIGVFQGRGSVEEDSNVSIYSNAIELEQAKFDEYYNFVKNNSLYNTGNTAKYGDKLLTLVTCDYDEEDGRLFVVAKKIA